MKLKTTLFCGAAAMALALPAAAESLRIQTHYAPETTSGKLAQEFVEQVAADSNGDLTIEMFYSSSVVKTVETFDAAANGIVDCDMTGGAYQIGKNPAFQFVGDIMGGYDNPQQQFDWLAQPGNLELVQNLYNTYGIQFIGWWMYGPESLASTTPLNGIDDLADFKFRSPPGMETEIFAKLGSSPVVMDFTEVFTALETGIIDGADASSLANNAGMGLYDIAKNATYPGFHSMPADHLACNKAKWDSLTDEQRAVVQKAMDDLGAKSAEVSQAANEEALPKLQEEGVTIADWSEEDRNSFRQAAQEVWQEWAARTPETKALVDSHIAYMKEIDLISE
ncbi:TRAP transporter substrate-binding protein [Paracoccus tegillarcae]|uniref:C4-dicarboxylate ABC transporter substrate-binding protein n=1 Tax=Paracoccus tegillarcae TaxID=1529068 RepID=A0A2K9EPA9_9RHOB|nr:TRAP transporter substrate-binding protein [Paracoccus tegillarcae]AUH33495.1 C4-dicarboxylate ABC transporter substrate-binding protein [Paracoccus tegillarcae]